MQSTRHKDDHSWFLFSLLSLFHCCLTQVCLPVVFFFLFFLDLFLFALACWCGVTVHRPVLVFYASLMLPISHLTLCLITRRFCFVVSHMSCVLPTWALERLPLNTFESENKIKWKKKIYFSRTDWCNHSIFANSVWNESDLYLCFFFYCIVEQSIQCPCPLVLLCFCGEAANLSSDDVVSECWCVSQK